MAPLVAVVIPCHDYGRFLPDAVGSVLAQTAELECLIVDDGSTDDSLEIARALALRDDRVRVHAQPCCGLPGVARNAGIALTSAPYVLCLDADDRLEPDFVARCVAALEADPSVSIAYGDQQDFGADDAFHVHPEYDFARLTRQNLIGTASLFRRAAWEDAGGYPPLRGYEDWSFWISCGERGHRGVHVPGAVFWYRTKPDGLFAEAITRDREYKARIVLGHPRVYGAAEVEWAAAALAGEAWAAEVDTETYLIPALGGPPGPYWSGARPEGTRSRVVLAHAEELRAEPGLLRAWTERVGADDDVTLVVLGAVDRRGEVDATLAAACRGRDAPDVLALPAVERHDLAALVQHADALYSTGAAGGVLAALPRISEPLAA